MLERQTLNRQVLTEVRHTDPSGKVKHLPAI